MLKDQDMMQMSLLGDSHVNHSQSQDKEKEQMMTDISGMKLLESSENVNPDGLLAKMLKELLVYSKAWYSDRCKMTWKKRVSKSNVCLYQLLASVHGITEKEYGLSHRMFPTPTASKTTQGMKPQWIKQNKTGWTVTRKGTGTKFGASLVDVLYYLEMYPTPLSRDHKEMSYNPTWRPKRDKSLPREVLKNNIHGGKMNPNFVEFLMGYPMDWTNIEVKE